MKPYSNWNPFELHVTFQPSDLEKVLKWSDGSYRIHCFDNIHSSGYIIDMMTSEVARCSSAECAFVKLAERVKDLEEDGVKVLRKKIETVPWFDQEYSFNEISTPYFETHMKVYGEPIQVGKSRLLLSKDRIKKTSIVTLRTEGDFEHHIDMLHGSIVSLVRNHTYVLGKPDTELVIFDSNRKLDAQWEKF